MRSGIVHFDCLYPLPSLGETGKGIKENINIGEGCSYLNSAGKEMLERD
jgi:hypothetical protein